MNGALHRDVRRALTALVVDLGDDEAAAVVPPTPAWRVRDVVAHVVGVTEDVVEGRMEGAPGPAWTAAQVERRRGATIRGMLDEWEAMGDRLDAIVDADPRRHWLVPVDAWLHEQDIRATLGLGSRADATLIEAALGMATAIPRRCAAAGLSTPSVSVGGNVVVDGDGPHIEAPSEFDLAMALFGRRSAAEVAAWLPPGADPGYPAALSVFPLPVATIPA